MKTIQKSITSIMDQAAEGLKDTMTKTPEELEKAINKADDAKSLARCFNELLQKGFAISSNKETIKFFKEHGYIIEQTGGQSRLIQEAYTFVSARIEWNETGQYLKQDHKGPKTWTELSNICRTTPAMNQEPTGYDKISFIIEYIDNETGEKQPYKGRYDVGSDTETLLQHIAEFVCRDWQTGEKLTGKDYTDGMQFIYTLQRQEFNEKGVK